MSRDQFLTMERDTEMDTPLRKETPEVTLKGVRTNIVQSIRAFRVQDLQAPSYVSAGQFARTGRHPRSAQSKFGRVARISDKNTAAAAVDNKAKVIFSYRSSHRIVAVKFKVWAEVFTTNPEDVWKLFGCLGCGDAKPNKYAN